MTPTITRPAHDTLQCINAFRPIQGEATALANRVRFTTASCKERLAADALRIRRGGRFTPAWPEEEQPEG